MTGLNLARPLFSPLMFQYQPQNIPVKPKSTAAASSPDSQDAQQEVQEQSDNEHGAITLPSDDIIFNQLNAVIQAHKAAMDKLGQEIYDTQNASQEVGWPSCMRTYSRSSCRH